MIGWKISRHLQNVSSGIQTLRSSLIKSRLRLVFSTHLSVFENSDEKLFLPRVWYITSNANSSSTRPPTHVGVGDFSAPAAHLNLPKFLRKAIQTPLLVRPIALVGYHTRSWRLNTRFISPLLIISNDFAYSQETLQTSYSLLLFLLVVRCVYMLRPFRFFARLGKVMSSAAYPLLACMVSFLF